MRQDYLFLIEYARLLALGAARAPDRDTMRRFAELTAAILTTEMRPASRLGRRAGDLGGRAGGRAAVARRRRDAPISRPHGGAGRQRRAGRGARLLLTSGFAHPDRSTYDSSSGRPGRARRTSPTCAGRTQHLILGGRARGTTGPGARPPARRRAPGRARGAAERVLRTTRSRRSRPPAAGVERPERRGAAGMMIRRRIAGSAQEFAAQLPGTQESAGYRKIGALAHGRALPPCMG